MHFYDRHAMRGTPMTCMLTGYKPEGYMATREAHERGPRERYVYSMHVLEGFITPAEEEQLEPFYKLLESRVGVSEVNNSEI